MVRFKHLAFEGPSRRVGDWKEPRASHSQKTLCDPPFVRSCLDFWTRNPKVGHVCIWLLLMLRSFHGRVLTHRRTLWCSKEMCFVQDSYCPQSPVTLRQQLAPVQIRWKRTYMASFGVNSRSDHENSQPHCEILATVWEQPGFLWLNAVSQKSISHR